MRLTQIVLAKIEEEIRLLEGLVTRVPPDRLSWTPAFPPASFPMPRTIGQVNGHLLQCLAGFLAVLHAAKPTELGTLLELRNRPVNHACAAAEALPRIDEYRQQIRAGFALLDDEDLGRTLPTVFVPGGVAILTLLLGNLEHLINHKHELFYYLKLLEIPLTSRDLYQFHEAAV